jgi:polysaccharide deacetylase 2 family uncharacterized protein YibQ
VTNDLSTPLKTPAQRRKAARTGRTGATIPWARAGVAVLALIASGAVAWLVFVDDPDGGRPIAEAEIASPRDTNTLADAVAAPSASAGPITITADPEQYPVSGNGPAITTIGADTPTTAPETGDAYALVPDLVEETEFGAIPRMSATGAAPFEAYAHPGTVTPGRPAVALVIVGLGINEAGSIEAVETLPDPVSLAFAPYGRALETVVSAARRDGHEIFLEIPLEPFDYPQNDPGPQTLLTGEQPRANLDKLFWLMARFGGYVGVVNNMGARFTASAADFAPIMEELGVRGLGYLDDGSSNRSVASQLAEANDVPFSRAVATIDTNPDAEAIRAALTALEDRARAEGSAIGIATALPVSVRTIAEWARQLEERGIALVPASALMQ